MKSMAPRCSASTAALTSAYPVIMITGRRDAAAGELGLQRQAGHAAQAERRERDTRRARAGRRARNASADAKTSTCRPADFEHPGDRLAVPPGSSSTTKTVGVGIGVIGSVHHRSPRVRLSDRGPAIVGAPAHHPAARRGGRAARRHRPVGASGHPLSADAGRSSCDASRCGSGWSSADVRSARGRGRSPWP